jgi:hypothetical protein
VNLEPYASDVGAKLRGIDLMRVTSLLRFAFVLIVVTVFGVAQTHACDCPCDEDSDCPNGEVCNLAIGLCVEPDGPCDDDSDCGGGQLCNPATGMCENPTDDCVTDADCADGVFCNGEEICDRFDGCLEGVIVDCGVSEDICVDLVCDEEIQGCNLTPRNDGEPCSAYEGDSCVIAAACGDGECLATPLCNERCERCDPAGCASLCGNPFGTATDVVNTTDALFALRASVALEQCELCVCDVNGDGVVTASDVLLMLRKIVGLSQLFVCAND